MGANNNKIVQFDFYGDSLEVVQHVDGKIYVSVRRVCQALGIGEWPQQRKLQSASWARTVKMKVHDTSGSLKV